MQKNEDLNSIDKLLDNFSYNDLWTIKGIIEKKLKEKSDFSITYNFTGERAVDMAIEIYNKNTSLPNLTRALNGTKDFDVYAPSTGERFSVKGIKGQNKTTSSICSFNDGEVNHNFEFVILVKLDELYNVIEILQIPLEIAKKYAKQNKRDKNFKITYSKKLKQDTNVNIVFSTH